MAKSKEIVVLSELSVVLMVADSLLTAEQIEGFSVQNMVSAPELHSQPILFPILKYLG